MFWKNWGDLGILAQTAKIAEFHPKITEFYNKISEFHPQIPKFQPKIPNFTPKSQSSNWSCSGETLGWSQGKKNGKKRGKKWEKAKFSKVWDGSKWCQPMGIHSQNKFGIPSWKIPWKAGRNQGLKQEKWGKKWEKIPIFQHF